METLNIEDPSKNYKPFPLIRLIWRFPCLILVAIVILTLGLAFAAFSLPFQVDSTGQTFVARGDTLSIQFLGQLAGLKRTEYDTTDLGVDEDQQSVATFFWTLIYRDEDGSDGEYNVFTKDAIQRMHQIEQAIIEHPDYEKYCLRNPLMPESAGELARCFPPRTMSNFFYPTVIGNTTIFDGRGEFINTPFEQHLQQILSNSPNAFDYFVDRNFNPQNPISPISRAVFAFGTPLEGYLNSEESADAQREKFKSWARGLRNHLNRNKFHSEFNMYWIAEGILGDELNEIIFGDAIFAVGSFAFVLIYAWFHVQSFFIAGLGLIGILFTFPITYFIYRIIMGFKWMNTLNFISLFIVIGIGADDLFILVDTWKQFKVDPSMNGDPVKVFAESLKDAARTMLITSLTTSVAFYCNSISIIPPIRQFGLFTGTIILVNYMIVITWFPSIIVLYSRYIEGKVWGIDNLIKLIVKKKSKNAVSEVDASTTTTTTTKEGFTEKTNQEKMRTIEKFFYSKFAPFTYKTRWALIVLFALLLSGGGYLTSRLESADSPARFLPDTNRVQIAFDIIGDDFKQSIETVSVSLVWGIAGTDLKGTDPNDPTDSGEPIWDNSFDISDPASQTWLLDACIRIKSQPFVLDPDQGMCFIDDFKDYVENVINSTFPVPRSSFQDALKGYTQYVIAGNYERDREGYQDLVRFDQNDGQLRFVQMIFNTTIFNSDPARVVQPIYDQWDEFMVGLLRTAPPGMSRGYHTCFSWVSMNTEKVLISSAINGIFISLSVSLVIVIVLTLNLFLSLLVIATIIGIVTVLIAWMVLIGWKLGIIESVCLTILVGLSIDYTVHLASTYNESKQIYRYQRMKDALSHIGISVFSAAITTLGASSLLFFCEILFFIKFGLFIFVNILFSTFFAFFLFVPMCHIVGPQGNQGELKHWYRFIRSKITSKPSNLVLPADDVKEFKEVELVTTPTK